MLVFADPIHATGVPLIRFALMLLVFSSALRDASFGQAETVRPRLAVLTDIGGDPDDTQSLIRLLLYANDFQIEALIASASGTRGELDQSITQPQRIHDVIDAYEEVLTNLQRHADGWPTAASLHAVVRSGNPQRERSAVGLQHETDGSKFLEELIDKSTPQRPLNIAIWGGQTDLAQTLFMIKHERGSDGLADFVKRFRVYDTNDQDGIADWMRSEFPGMFYVLAKAPKGIDKRQGTYRGMYLGGDQSLTSKQWVETNVRSVSAIGAIYPAKTYTKPNPHGCMKEGDTPSWFFFLPAGGNDPNDPTKPGWGGRFVRQTDGWYRDLPISADFDPRQTVSRWRPDFQADFARRMSWTAEPATNHEEGH